MKKSLLPIILLALLVLAACGNNNHKNDQSDKGQTGNTVADNSVATSGTVENDISKSDQQLIETIPPEPTPTPFPTDDIKEFEGYYFTFKDTTNLYNEPNKESYIHKELESGTGLHITGKYSDKWYLVNAGDVQGYILRSDFATSKGYVNADEVKFREKASRTGDIKAELSQQTKVIVIDRKDDWYKAALADDLTVGYIYADYVSYSDAYVTADDVRLREAPNTECQTKTRIEQGSKVSIISEYDNWYKVSVGEFTGYMSKDYIAYSPEVRKVAKERGYLRDSGVNLREGPSTDCKSLGRLAKYAPVYITGETDEWYRVLYNEQEGFISRDFVEKGRLLVYVTSQDVNLRAGPGTDTDLLTKVRQNSEFEIIGSSGEWLKGIVNHNTGYIRSDYLSEKTVNGGEKKNEFTEAEIALAAKVVYLEARDHGTEAYRAVANVIYNRVKSHKFPNTVKGVVFEAGQFSVTWHSNFSTVRPSSEAYRATKDVLNGGIRPMPFNVLFFHASYLGKNWGNDKRFYRTVGDNTFFRYVG